jgi:hypothetical protein
MIPNDFWHKSQGIRVVVDRGCIFRCLVHKRREEATDPLNPLINLLPPGSREEDGQVLHKVISFNRIKYTWQD